MGDRGNGRKGKRVRMHGGASVALAALQLVGHPASCLLVGQKVHRRAEVPLLRFLVDGALDAFQRVASLLELLAHASALEVHGLLPNLGRHVGHEVRDADIRDVRIVVQLEVDGFQGGGQDTTEGEQMLVADVHAAQVEAQLLDRRRQTTHRQAHLLRGGTVHEGQVQRQELAPRVVADGVCDGQLQVLHRIVRSDRGDPAPAREREQSSQTLVRLGVLLAVFRWRLALLLACKNVQDGVSVRRVGGLCLLNRHGERPLDDVGAEGPLARLLLLVAATRRHPLGVPFGFGEALREDDDGAGLSSVAGAVHGRDVELDVGLVQAHNRLVVAPHARQL
mmetsp:Transcript_103477/g.297257  ORF Transcript_103477/g.297257 Transcript_103477/m.297257 type:complete len:336 (-) Transcript_103477:1122-2129(-)